MKTFAELYDPAMAITDQVEADAYLERIVDHIVSVNPELAREEALRVQRGNLAYWAGYYGSETRERVERLFKCEHPVFGAIAVKGEPTPEKAFRMGVEMGRKGRKP